MAISNPAAAQAATREGASLAHGAAAQAAHASRGLSSR